MHASFGVVGEATNYEGIFVLLSRELCRDSSTEHQVLATGLCEVAWMAVPETFVNKIVGVFLRRDFMSDVAKLSSPSR